MEKIETVEQFEQICLSHRPFLLMKHSLTCPISHRAWGSSNVSQKIFRTFMHIIYMYNTHAHCRNILQKRFMLNTNLLKCYG